MKKRLLVVFFLLACIILMSTLPYKNYQAKSFHSSEDLEFIKTHIMTPMDSGEYFLVPSNCRGCHGFDSLALSNIDASGMDVNLYDDWETSMMGLAAVDPFWRAKVSHEILVNPSHSNELQTLCTTCHAPMGHFSALFKGQTHYTLSDLATDSLGQAGVACMGCHSIKDTSTLGALFTGQIPYDTNRAVFGPFPAPLAGPMQLYVDLLPMYSSHVGQGRMCSPCHTLISNSVDTSGNPTGTTFVEQATYHEWVNSVYPGSDTTCQTCHMPQIEDPIQIANGYGALPFRTPFNLHQFSGANSFMVSLIKNNKTSLNVLADDKNFDSTLVAINNLLLHNTLNINAFADSITNDTAYFNVELQNKAGHKFPSGYPSRRAVLQFVVTKANGDTLFASGIFDSNYEVKNINTPFEIHHKIINSQLQSQIYEMIMGDVNGNRTTVLERAFTQLKDNRIPPVGFNSIHSAYDTCRIVGDAVSDPDFNKKILAEGTGKDVVDYRVPLNGYTGLLNLKTTVYYQTLPPAFLDEMSAFSSAEIDSFLIMYNNADRSPVFICSDSIINIGNPAGINNLWQQSISISPIPTNNGTVQINSPKAFILSADLFDLKGQKQKISITKINRSEWDLKLPPAKGIYLLQLRTQKGIILKKLVNL